MEAAALSKCRKPVFLTGTGMSAESGVPAYREKEDSGAYCIEINPEPSSARCCHRITRKEAGKVLPELFSAG